MIRRLLKDDRKARAYLERYSVYIMPMANKDGVARGMTRLNLRGKDLNRNWNRPANPQLAPENAALESWIEDLYRQGKQLDFVVELHNDSAGKIHVTRPRNNPEATDRQMERYEMLLRKHTWFSEGRTGGSFINPGTLSEGLFARYHVVGCVQELNANWIARLNDYPSGRHWESFGEGLCEVFYEYLGPK